MENSNKLGTNFESESRSPLKEISVKNNKPAEANENLNKTFNVDMESPQIPAIVARDTEANSDNQENQEPVSFLSNFDPLKAETSDTNLSDSQYDDAVSAPEAESIADTTIDNSFITAFANKLIVSSKLDESSKTQVSVSEVNLEEQNCNEQKEIVIDEDSVLTDDLSDSQNNVTFYAVNTELPESQEEITTCDYNLNESIKPVVTENSIENSNNTLNNNQQITEKNSESIKPVVAEDSIENSNKTLNNNQQIAEKNSESIKPVVTEDSIENFNKTLKNNQQITEKNSESIKPVITEDSIENSNNPLNNNQQILEKKSEVLISDAEHIVPKTDVTLDETYTEPKNENSDINTTVEIVTNTVEEICQQEITKTAFEVTPDTFEVTKPPVSDEIIHPENIGAEINDNIQTAILIDISGNNINQSFEKNKSFNQDTEQETINEQKSCLLESFNSTDNSNSKTLIDTSDSLPCTNIVTEEVHMSSSEPISDVKEISNRLSLENSATSTNDMGEIIECFEKQLDVSNGAVDNKESLEAKEQIYKEMTEKYAILEAESEKYKTQVCDLKKELKICRQKTVALEAEVADLKRRENELSILLEEKNKSPVETGSGTDQDEQVKRLQASEEALKNEVIELKGLVKQHENTLKDLQKKEVKLTDDLSCKTQSELQISRIMEEYEKSIATLISENEKMKKERDTAQMHLANIEMAFSDVHQKYERCKSIVQGYKDNEESFKQDIAMNRETIVIQEQKYETLKAHAMAQLEKSNQELAAMKKQHEGEIARLTAQLKRYEIKNMALAESLEQKAKECEQLAAICDEYIGSV